MNARAKFGIADAEIEAALTEAMASGIIPPAAFFAPRVGGNDLDDFDEYKRKRRVRDWFIDRYGFAVPCREAIDAIAAHGPVLEVGAGSGMWSRILSHHVDVVATDIAVGQNAYRQAVGVWHPVSQAAAVEAVAAHQRRTVLMVWPSYNEGWAADVAESMAVGTVLAYVGEGAGGCTGDERFHDMLAQRFTEIADVYLPQFDGIHDYLSVLRKAR